MIKWNTGQLVSVGDGTWHMVGRTIINVYEGDTRVTVDYDQGPPSSTGCPAGKANYPIEVVHAIADYSHPNNGL